MFKNVPFYGWYLVGFLWIIYGFGISPCFYSWGLLSKEMIADLGFNQTRFGTVHGVFIFLYSGAGVLVGLAQKRIGIRWLMVMGALSTSVGIFIMSRADTMWECIIGFSVLGGIGIGFTTIVPCQTVAQNWFLKRRALAIALIFSAGGIVGRLWAKINGVMLDQYTWRDAWLLIAVVSFILAIIAAVFVRDTPEELGTQRDGANPDDDDASEESQAVSDLDKWTPRLAMRTWQFALMAFCGVAYATPWGVVVAFGRLHLEGIGLDQNVALGIVGTMALVSILGRLSGAVGDIVSPTKVLAGSLLIEGIGLALFLIADTSFLAHAAVIMIGIGFGTAYISVPVVFSAYFGRNAFATTVGVRILITGVFNSLGPIITGAIFDARQSYTIPFVALSVLAVCGAVAAAMLRPPTPPIISGDDPSN